MVCIFAQILQKAAVHKVADALLVRLPVKMEVETTAVGLFAWSRELIQCTGQGAVVLTELHLQVHQLSAPAGDLSRDGIAATPDDELSPQFLGDGSVIPATLDCHFGTGTAQHQAQRIQAQGSAIGGVDTQNGFVIVIRKGGFLHMADGQRHHGDGEGLQRRRKQPSDGGRICQISQIYALLILHQGHLSEIRQVLSGHTETGCLHHRAEELTSSLIATAGSRGDGAILHGASYYDSFYALSTQFLCQGVVRTEAQRQHHRICGDSDLGMIHQPLQHDLILPNLFQGVGQQEFGSVLIQPPADVCHIGVVSRGRHFIQLIHNGDSITLSAQIFGGLNTGVARADDHDLFTGQRHLSGQDLLNGVDIGTMDAGDALRHHGFRTRGHHHGIRLECRHSVSGNFGVQLNFHTQTLEGVGIIVGHPLHPLFQRRLFGQIYSTAQFAAPIQQRDLDAPLCQGFGSHHACRTAAYDHGGVALKIPFQITILPLPSHPGIQSALGRKARGIPLVQAFEAAQAVDALAQLRFSALLDLFAPLLIRQPAAAHGHEVLHVVGQELLRHSRLPDGGYADDRDVHVVFDSLDELPPPTLRIGNRLHAGDAGLIQAHGYINKINAHGL